MYGEFKISIKRRNDYEVIAALQNMYPAHDLENARSESQVISDANWHDYIFGYQNHDVLMLARITDGQLKVIIENLKNDDDLVQLKSRIDEYHCEVKKGLKRRNFKTHRSSATITIDRAEIKGKWPDKLKDIWAEIRKKGEKIFVEPLTALFVSFLALHFKIFDIKEYSSDVKKTFIILAESYMGIVALLVVKLFIQKTEKSFKFYV